MARPDFKGFVGPGMRLEGDIVFEGRIRVDGELRGRVYTDDVLEVGPTGLVEGELDVANAVVLGRLNGKIRVRERLRLERGGLIEGQLDVGLLEPAPGGRIQAVVRLHGKELP
jgi:cytoskeletal protein CcmA (bactofilin family)